MFTWSAFWLSMFLEGIRQSIYCPRFLVRMATYQPKSEFGKEWAETVRNLCAGFR